MNRPPELPLGRHRHRVVLFGRADLLGPLAQRQPARLAHMRVFDAGPDGAERVEGALQVLGGPYLCDVHNIIGVFLSP